MDSSKTRPSPSSEPERPSERWGRCHLAIARLFGVGRLPVAPGTWGSLATILLYRLFLTELSWVQLLVLTVVVAAVGIWSGGVAERILGSKDPGEVVIDEVAGQLVALLAIHQTSVWSDVAVAFAFLLFRFFDVLKPFPCHRLQKVRGGWGIMIDDLVAGLYAGVLTYAGAWFFSG